MDANIFRVGSGIGLTAADNFLGRVGYRVDVCQHFLGRAGFFGSSQILHLCSLVGLGSGQSHFLWNMCPVGFESV